MKLRPLERRTVRAELSDQTIMNTSHEYEIHPLSRRMPEMADAEFTFLKESIQRDGFFQPIVVYQGKILDGRHRYRACRELQIVPQFVELIHRCIAARGKVEVTIDGYRITIVWLKAPKK